MVDVSGGHRNMAGQLYDWACSCLVERTRSMMPVFPFLDGGAVASIDNIDNSVSTELCQCRYRVSVHSRGGVQVIDSGECQIA